MTSELINSLVDAVNFIQEIQIYELSSALLARDSYILSLEAQIELLKFELKSTKSKTSYTTETQTFENISLIDSSIQTINKSFEVQIQQGLTIRPSLSNKKESLNAVNDKKKEINCLQKDTRLEENSETRKIEKTLSLSKLDTLSTLNYISAINSKYNLPITDSYPRNKNISASKKTSDNKTANIFKKKFNKIII